MHHRKPRYRLAEAFKLLDISQAYGYRQAKAGKLRISKDGKRSFITAAEIDRYASLGSAAPEPAPRPPLRAGSNPLSAARDRIQPATR